MLLTLGLSEQQANAALTASGGDLHAAIEFCSVFLSCIFCLLVVL